MQTKKCDTCQGPAKFGNDVPPPERGATVFTFSGPTTVRCATCLATTSTTTTRLPVQGRGL